MGEKDHEASLTSPVCPCGPRPVRVHTCSTSIHQVQCRQRANGCTCSSEGTTTLGLLPEGHQQLDFLVLLAKLTPQHLPTNETFLTECTCRFLVLVSIYPQRWFNFVNVGIMADVDGTKIERLQDLSATIHKLHVKPPRTKLDTLAEILNSPCEIVGHVTFTSLTDGVSLSKETTLFPLRFTCGEMEATFQRVYHEIGFLPSLIGVQ